MQALELVQNMDLTIESWKATFHEFNGYYISLVYYWVVYIRILK